MRAASGWGAVVGFVVGVAVAAFLLLPAPPDGVPDDRFAVVVAVGIPFVAATTALGWLAGLLVRRSGARPDDTGPSRVGVLGAVAVAVLGLGWAVVSTTGLTAV